MEPRSMDGLKSIEAVNKSLRIVEALKEMDGARVTELADELGWAKSTVHSHLESLESNEYVVQENGQYVLGFRFLEIGEYVKHRKSFYSLIQPKIDELAEETGERVQFVTNEHGDGVYVRIAEGDRAVSTGSYLGHRRTMLHATAAGKAILAHLPEDEVERIIDRKGLVPQTPNTITDREELFQELEEVREKGFAFNREEHIEGLQAVAAPIEDPDDNVLGALSIAGPAHRMRGEWLREELPDHILGVRNEIELDIAYR